MTGMWRCCDCYISLKRSIAEININCIKNVLKIELAISIILKNEQEKKERKKNTKLMLIF